MSQLDRKHLTDRINLFRKTGSYAETARRQGVSRSTVKESLDVAISKGWWTGKVNDEPKVPEIVHEAAPLAMTPKQRAKHERDTKSLISDLRQKIADLEWASNVDFEPADWTYKPRARTGKSQHIGYLLTSDFHAGEVVDESDLGLSKYNSHVFRNRYRTLIETAIELATTHVSKAWTIEGFVYARAGDSVAGSIHEELRETNDLKPMQAVECVFEQEAAGIRELHKAFGRVEVKTPGAGGNHDRDTLKMHHKRAAAHNYDRLVAFMLAREFRPIKGISFQTSDGFDVGYNVYNTNILLTHGDRIGSRGGQGFIGPAATILRGVQKVMGEQAALGNYVDRVDIGHFHYPMDLPAVLSNGSLVGHSEYGKMLRSRPLPPVQYLQFFNPKHGVVDSRPIKVAKLARKK